MDDLVGAVHKELLLLLNHDVLLSWLVVDYILLQELIQRYLLVVHREVELFD